METQETQQTKPPKEETLSFLDHLEELRRRIIFILISFIIFAAIGYFFKEDLYLLLVEPLNDPDIKVQMIHTKPYEKFMAYLKISIYAGIIMSFPVIIYQMSLFILPALYQHERKWYFSSLVVVSILFFIGTFFAYKILTPISLKFLLTFGNPSQEEISDKEKRKRLEKLKNDKILQPLQLVNKNLNDVNNKLNSILVANSNPKKELAEVYALLNDNYSQLAKLMAHLKKEKFEKQLDSIASMLNISDYLDWLLFFILVIGLVFQLPLVITILAKIGIVNAKMLSSGRPYAVIIILIVAAVITPPDVVSQIGVGIPIYLLYEISIIMAKIVGKKQDESSELDAI